MTAERGLPIGAAGAVVTVGTFDGVHRGHHDVLERLCARAHASQRPSVVVTFDPHPLQIVNPQHAPPLLTNHQERLELLAQSDVSYVAVLPFTPWLAAMEAETFVDDVLRRRYGMSELLVGHDHGFGRGRMGDIGVVRALAESRGFAVTVLDPVVGADGQPISSSAIRRHVASGALDRAAEALGRPYSVSGRVVGGERRGRLLGYPTVNLASPPATKLLPPDGVYAVRVQTPEGPFGGMMNLGGRPTFGESGRRLETHVFDADRDWYGAALRIDFVSRLRDVQTFADGAALAAQLSRDEAAARQHLSPNGYPLP